MVIGLSDEELAKLGEMGHGLYDWLKNPPAPGSSPGEQLIKHGVGLSDTWATLAYRKEPDDFFGKIFFWAGMISQLVINLITAPFGIAAFLLEESAQSIGMGGYFLFTAKEWEILEDYMPVWKNALDAYSTTAKAFAMVNPIGAGAVLIYLDAAKVSRAAMETVAIKQILIKAETDEKARQKLLDDNKYGTIHLASLPTGANITLDGVDQEVETPELFKKLEAGSHKFTLVKEKAATGEKWEYELTTNVTAGKRKEITIHLKQTAGETKTPGSVDETPETKKIPDFIKAEVTGDYAIDGDTFVTTSGEHVRVLGIDAPELGRPYADLAKTFLESKTADKKVVLSIQTHLPIDAYGRTLALCTYRDENLSVALVAAGLAKSDIFPDARYDPTRILEAEKIAKERRIGIWSEIP